ncbi:MAG: peptide MFS transporter [Elusimicrobiales bacterium]|nr:peptide MFS transporter [Elusimicrobiales bacterium]
MSIHKDQPKGLYLLFFVEMWERFSYYGMRALLVLYMVKYLQFSMQKAGSVYGWYTGLVYLTPLIGGYIADRYLGQRKCIVIGAVLMSLGHFAMAFPPLPFFYTALILLIIGNGFFKPNISTVVGSLYAKNDPRRDGGFTIFYMGINLGAIFSPLICGTLGEKIGWHWGFGAAGIGMLLGLGMYLWGQKKFLGNHCMYPACSSKDREIEDKPLTLVEKKRIAVIFIMTFFAIFFWSAFEQAGSSLTMFADRETDRLIPFINMIFPTSWFQSINPLFIIIFAPFFSNMWTAMGEAKREPSTPIKFIIGLGLLAVGFMVMAAAAALYQQSGPVSMLWLVAVYFFHTMGELCLSPFGLSMVTKLSPPKFVSLLMGVWLLSSFAANLVGGLFAGNYDTMNHTTFYMIPTGTALGAALLLLLMAPKLKKWMHGIH